MIRLLLCLFPRHILTKEKHFRLYFSVAAHAQKKNMSGGNGTTNGSSALRDFLLAPDGCAPDDDDSSSASQNPIMRLTDKILWPRRRERVRSGKTDAKRPTDGRDVGRPKANDGRQTRRERDDDEQRLSAAAGTGEQNGSKDRERGRTSWRDKLHRRWEERERQLVQQQQQQQQQQSMMDHAWQRERDAMVEQRQREMMMMRERNEVGSMAPAPMMEMQMRHQQQDWGGEFSLCG